MDNDMPKDVIIVLDLSISMKKPIGDFIPSKLQVMIDTVGLASQHVISKTRHRIGLVAFFAFVIPLLPPTHDINKLIKTLAILEYTGEGSALGDAIIESVKLIRNSLRRRQIIVITDGELNVGSPLELAVIYSKNMKVDLNIVTIGVKDKVPLKYKLNELQMAGFLEWRHADKRTELFRNLSKLLYR